MKLVDQFTYLGSNNSSTESDVSIHIVKELTANKDHIKDHMGI